MVKDGEMRRGITLERVNSLVGPKAITNSRLTKEPRTKERKGRGHRVGREIQGDRKGKISRLIGEREIEKKRDGERERKNEERKERLVPEICGSLSIRLYTRTVSNDFNWFCHWKKRSWNEILEVSMDSSGQEFWVTRCCFAGCVKSYHLECHDNYFWKLFSNQNRHCPQYFFKWDFKWKNFYCFQNKF